MSVHAQCTWGTSIEEMLPNIYSLHIVFELRYDIITLWGWENTEIRFIYLFICQSDYAFPLDSIFSSIVTFELIAQTYM